MTGEDRWYLTMFHSSVDGTGVGKPASPGVENEEGKMEANKR